jgi:hypothetical protein
MWQAGRVTFPVLPSSTGYMKQAVRLPKAHNDKEFVENNRELH